MVPSYLCVQKLGLINSYWALILTALISSYHVLILTSFLRGIRENCWNRRGWTGAGEFRVMLQVVAPLAKASFATIGLWVIAGHWNAYFGPLLYITKSERFTLQQVLREIVLEANAAQMDLGTARGGQVSVNIADQIRYGVLIVSMVPMMVIYPFVQKYFVKGVTLGAVKGKHTIFYDRRMSMRKKTVARMMSAVITGSMIISLAACGSSSAPTAESAPVESVAASTEAETTEETTNTEPLEFPITVRSGSRIRNLHPIFDELMKRTEYDDRLRMGQQRCVRDTACVPRLHPAICPTSSAAVLLQHPAYRI